MLRFLFKIIRYILITFISLCVLIVVNHFLIGAVGDLLVVDDEDDLTGSPVVLILGAGSSEHGKWVNLNFENRMAASKWVYDNNPVKAMVLSGKFQPPYYDEPMAMYRSLSRMGIPDSALVADYRGVRTWESVKSAREQFPDEKILIIAQRPQLQRALFISIVIGADAEGLAAEPSPYHHWYWTYREVLARAKCTLDCFAFILKIN
jgi:SanA protein